MATDCGTCENSDYEDPKCCPETVESGHGLDVRDRNCNVRRIIPAAGIVGVAHEKFKQLTGTQALPIAGLDIEQVTATPGFVIAQTPEGRLLAIIPEEGTDTATVFGLIYRDGQLLFAPVNSLTNTFIDADTESVTNGTLAVFSCSGDGNLKLAKLLPACTGTRALVIDTEGTVTCDEVEVGACRDVEDVDELDSVWGCKDGIFSPILPVEGKTLIGAGDPVKWTLGNAGSGIELLNPRVQLASGGYAGVNNGIMHSSNISWASQPGYLASYRYVIVRAIAQLGSRGMDTVGELRMDGQNMVSVKVREHPTLTCDHDTDTNQQILAIPGSKTSLLEFVLTDLGNSQANALNEAAFNFYLEGWVS